MIILTIESMLIVIAIYVSFRTQLYNISQSKNPDKGQNNATLETILIQIHKGI